MALRPGVWWDPGQQELPVDRTPQGVTLLEVIVVLGIAAGAAALLWRVEPLGARLALRAAAAGLVSDLRMMQARAIGERNAELAYGVELAVGGDRYTLFARAGRGRVPLRTRVLPPGVRITYARFGGTNSGTVFFTGVSLFGAPSGGGTVTFGAGGARLCVRIAPATARPRVARAGCP